MNPRIVAICGPLEGSVFKLMESSYLKIGRGKNNHFRLADSRIAARHCCINYEYGNCLLFVLENERGTFVNEFARGGKILMHGDRIKIGVSLFVFFDREDVDPTQLKLTKAEKAWFDAVSYPRLEIYEPAKESVLDAFLHTISSITGLRSSEEIQAEVFELIFGVIPVDQAAILFAGHDQDDFISTTYRSRARKSDAFPIDEAISTKALRDAQPIYQEKIGCCPVTVAKTKVGVIYAVIDKATFEFFTSGHAKLFDSIAGITSVALEHARYVKWLEGENQDLNEIINVEHGMIGRSQKMKQAYDFVNRAGPSDRTILITGETGTGKELLARALHRHSPRRDKRLFAVNCAAFPESLL